jgi:hypothetical protein
VNPRWQENFVSELRIVRLVVTLAFVACVIWCIAELTWGRAVGAGFFGFFTMFLWGPEVRARADQARTESTRTNPTLPPAPQPGQLGAFGQQPYDQQYGPQSTEPTRQGTDGWE